MSEGTELATWDPTNDGGALPAYLTDTMDEVGTNIVDRGSVPSLSYEGKTWTIKRNGNDTKLQKVDDDGDLIPVSVMRMVILGYNPDRGRAYYEGTYNPANSTSPKCWSADGVKPDDNAEAKQAATCKSCPMSVKGSKIGDGGREMIACSSHRMVGIVPAGEIDGEPLRLKIAVTSDYDKNVVEHGWFAFRQYVDFLKSRGITHTALVVTKVKFDNNEAYPKLLFSVDRLLTQEEVGAMRKALENPALDDLLNEKWSAAAGSGAANGARAKPTDPNHIHNAGQDGELWWDGDAWVSPWETAPPPPATEKPADPPPPATEKPAEPAAKPKPTDEAHIAHAGTEHEVWWDGAAWVAPWVKVEQAKPAEPEKPAAPAAPKVEEKPAAPAVAAHDPVKAAEADGWIKHPETEGYHYKGTEVVLTTDLAGKYPASDAGSAASDAASQSAAPAATADDIPADVKEMLGKWGDAE